MGTIQPHRGFIIAGGASIALALLTELLLEMLFIPDTGQWSTLPFGTCQHRNETSDAIMRDENYTVNSSIRVLSHELISNCGKYQERYYKRHSLYLIVTTIKTLIVLWLIDYLDVIDQFWKIQTNIFFHNDISQLCAQHHDSSLPNSRTLH